MVDLKPCPFCNARLERSEAFSRRTASCYVHPEGSDCIIGGIMLWSNDLGRIAAWNRRADADRIAVLEEVVGNTITLCDAMAADTDCPVPGWYASLAALRQGAAAALAGEDTEKDL